MPGRATPLVTNEVYHVFNRGIDYRPTFLDKNEFSRAMKVMNFYRFAHLPLRLSVFLTWANERRKKLIEELEKTGEFLVEIFSYCLMPTHFHFLLRQRTEEGIAKFMSNFQNSYTRYFNTKHQRIGPLLLDQFKAVRIENDNQLLHVSRYIHLNPYSSFLVKNIKELENYPWSSLSEFSRLRKGFSSLEILSYFKKESDFKRFIFDQADYQRNLEKIKHLLFE